jgi:acyl-CoA synthetase (NDP forming)
MDAKQITNIISAALGEGRDALTELEGLDLLEAMGIATPGHAFVAGSGEAEARAGGKAFFPGARAVVKVISPDILHKTEVGGVAIVPNELPAILGAMRDMERRFALPLPGHGGAPRVEGYTVNEFVSFEPKIGHEMIVGYRFAKDFGPVVSFGPGGIFAEYLASNFKEGSASLFLSPAIADRASVAELLSHNVVRTLAAGGLRNTAPAIGDGAILDVVMAFLGAAGTLAAAGVSEFEVNPFAVAPSREAGGPARLVALDVLVKLAPVSGELEVAPSGRIANSRQAARPVDKIDRLLAPRSAAIAGVSEKSMNNGRVMLRNFIANGFDKDRLYVVKPGCESIEGCPCYPDFRSLPEPVDLAVLSVPASSAAKTIAEIAESAMAETIIVTTGGLEEKSGTEKIVAHMRKALDDSRKTAGRGPLINGGNCLGVRSAPGRYNNLFIPEYKLPMPKGRVAPVAIISQSGAFAVSRTSKHQNINPKYLITCGNQLDLTVGDYLERLAEDAEIKVFAAYVEGFKPLDGEKALRAAKRIVDSGRSFILYRAGRSAAGAKASASHTASIAGDYPVTKALFGQAGAVVVDSLEEFDDALSTFTLLLGKRPQGLRLGAISNAGFECVAIADNLGALGLADFAPETKGKLAAIFEKAKVNEIVDIHNPIDLTPGAPDFGYDEGFKAILADPNVDCGMVGIVPLTQTMNTLAAGPDSHGEDVTREGSLAVSYGRLIKEGDKPWVAAVDAGILYDPLAHELEARGVPTFRTADRALKMLNTWIRANSRN